MVARVVVGPPGWLVRHFVRHTGGPVLSAIETKEPVVALTIDDGPDVGTTPRILDVVERHGARGACCLISGRVAGVGRSCDARWRMVTLWR